MFFLIATAALPRKTEYPLPQVNSRGRIARNALRSEGPADEGAALLRGAHRKEPGS